MSQCGHCGTEIPRDRDECECQWLAAIRPQRVPPWAWNIVLEIKSIEAAVFGDDFAHRLHDQGLSAEERAALVSRLRVLAESVANGPHRPDSDAWDDPQLHYF